MRHDKPGIGLRRDCDEELSFAHTDFALRRRGYRFLLRDYYGTLQAAVWQQHGWAAMGILQFVCPLNAPHALCIDSTRFSVTQIPTRTSQSSPRAPASRSGKTQTSSATTSQCHCQGARRWLSSSCAILTTTRTSRGVRPMRSGASSKKTLTTRKWKGEGGRTATPFRKRQSSQRASVSRVGPRPLKIARGEWRLPFLAARLGGR